MKKIIIVVIFLAVFSGCGGRGWVVKKNVVHEWDGDKTEILLCEDSATKCYVVHESKQFCSSCIKK